MPDFSGDRACEGPGATHFGCVCLVAEINRQAAENTRLRDALGWYADESTWGWEPGLCLEEPDGYSSLAELDAGKTARAALGEESDRA